MDEEFNDNFLNELDFGSLIDDALLISNESDFSSELNNLDDEFGLGIEPFGVNANFNGKLKITQ